MAKTKHRHFKSMTPGDRLAMLRDPDPSLVQQITKMFESGGPAEYNQKLCASMSLLLDAGWSLRPLGTIIGYSQEAVRKMIRRHLALPDDEREEAEANLPLTVLHLKVTHGRRKPKNKDG